MASLVKSISSSCLTADTDCFCSVVKLVGESVSVRSVIVNESVPSESVNIVSVLVSLAVVEESDNKKCH